MFLLDPDSGLKAVVGHGGRHPNVGDHHVGQRVPPGQFGDGGQERISAGFLPDDLVALALQEPDEPFTEQGGVVGH